MEESKASLSFLERVTMIQAERPSSSFFSYATFHLYHLNIYYTILVYICQYEKIEFPTNLL